MPLLSYSSSNFPFTPFTKIYSADINACYNDIKTLLNVTGLDSTNIQVGGVNRNRLATGTAGAVIINSGTGAMSELVLSSSPGEVLQTNSTATAAIFGPTPPPATEKVFMFQNFT